MTIIPLPSPNFHKGRKVRCVVLHATATSAAASPKAWLTDPKSKVSAHYIVDRDGAIYRLVAEEDVAWHAGESRWNDRPDVNDFSVGIEMVNANDGVQPYPEAQQAATAWLVAEVLKRHRLAPSAVVGHLDIAPGRKTDPAAFPWDDLQARLPALLGAA